MNTQNLKLWIATLCVIFIFAPVCAFSYTVIKGNLKPGETQDTIYLDILSEFGTGNFYYPPDTTLISSNKDGSFKFEFQDTKKPFYVSLKSNVYRYELPAIEGRNYRLEQYLIMPGDEIIIEFDKLNNRLKFKGKGAFKFQWKYNLDLSLSNRRDDLRKLSKQGALTAVKYFNDQDLLLNLALESVDKNKEQFSPEEYLLLRADILGRMLGGIAGAMASYNFNSSKTKVNLEYVTEYQKRNYNQFDLDNSAYIASSKFYATYLMHKARATTALEKLLNISPVLTAYESIKRYPPGVLRDKVIMTYITRQNFTAGFNDSLTRGALSIVKSDQYKSMLLKSIAINTNGSEIDDSFTFTDNNSKPVKISDFKGKVVVLDVWFTGCTGCIQVAEGLPKVEKVFYDRDDIIFVSCSIDTDKALWLRSINPDLVPSKTSSTNYTHFTTSTAKYIYTSGTGYKNEFIKKYNPLNVYPLLLVIGKDGRMLMANPTKPFNNDGISQLIYELQSALK